MIGVDILLRSRKKKRKVCNHRKLERKGIVNYLYFNKPLIIINRRTRTLVINDWNNKQKGTNRALQDYLDSATIKYIMKNMNYTIRDYRKRNITGII